MDVLLPLRLPARLFMSYHTSVALWSKCHDINNIPQKLRCLWQQTGEISQREHGGSNIPHMHQNEYVYFLSSHLLIRF